MDMVESARAMHRSSLSEINLEKKDHQGNLTSKYICYLTSTDILAIANSNILLRRETSHWHPLQTTYSRQVTEKLINRGGDVYPSKLALSKSNSTITYSTNSEY